MSNNPAAVTNNSDFVSPRGSLTTLRESEKDKKLLAENEKTAFENRCLEIEMHNMQQDSMVV